MEVDLIVYRFTMDTIEMSVVSLMIFFHGLLAILHFGLVSYQCLHQQARVRDRHAEAGA